MVDARGLSCPMPVLMVQKAVKAENPDTLEVIVDDVCPLQNVTRFAESAGYKVTYVQKGEEYHMTLSR